LKAGGGRIKSSSDPGGDATYYKWAGKSTPTLQNTVGGGTGQSLLVWSARRKNTNEEKNILCGGDRLKSGVLMWNGAGINLCLKKEKERKGAQGKKTFRLPKRGNGARSNRDAKTTGKQGHGAENKQRRFFPYSHTRAEEKGIRGH